MKYIYLTDFELQCICLRRICQCRLIDIGMKTGLVNFWGQVAFAAMYIIFVRLLEILRLVKRIEDGKFSKGPWTILKLCLLLGVGRGHKSGFGDGWSKVDCSLEESFLTCFLNLHDKYDTMLTSNQLLNM